MEIFRFHLVFGLLIPLIQHSVSYLGPRQGTSCVERCDVEYNPDWPCQCNEECVEFGSCCEDYEEVCLSCQDRCGIDYNHFFPCQCNDECPFHGNCCENFDQHCERARAVTDEELRTLTEDLLELDVNNVGRFVTVDLQGLLFQGPNIDCEEEVAPGPLFIGELPEEVTSIETVAKMMALFDNYNPYTTDEEDVTFQEEEEVDAFLDAVIATPVMEAAYHFLLEKGEIQDDENAFKERLKEMWFELYPRDADILGSCGFENVFMGQLRSTEVLGFHGWFYFYDQEQNEQGQGTNYLGYMDTMDFGEKGFILRNSFDWRERCKPISSLYIGASPELEMALFTVCFIARPDSYCPISLAGQDLHIHLADCCEDYETVCLGCKDRCGIDHDDGFPCQCHDECIQEGNCCQDFRKHCGGSTRLVTDEDLRILAESLLEMDVNNVGGLVTVELQGQTSQTGGDEASEPLFVGELPEEIWSIETVAKMMALFDNYEPNITESENVTFEEEEEVDAFLDAVIATDVMRSAYQFLVDKEEIPEDPPAFKERLEEMWFEMYPRDGDTLGSSGFEHVFMGEFQGTAVTGFHGWFWFYLQERASRMNYFGYMNYRNLTDKVRRVHSRNLIIPPPIQQTRPHPQGILLDLSFEWDGHRKPISTTYIGVSPELELALLTVCFVARPDSLCPVRLAGEELHVQTVVMEYEGTRHVGTAYFVISS
ncbi:unnamed protein product [Darwinula stevensoni]|uniref:Uncharacterized protein n=1 Tax=Darwinula stevensoni TaxID=69355 RepID=A0A7R9FR75_9CRUS|nr:unnamed protein product [Darwinula stevensoni]CAG0901122.1 unnamed protein product [Darwinula stevensoni]